MQTFPAQHQEVALGAKNYPHAMKQVVFANGQDIWFWHVRIVLAAVFYDPPALPCEMLIAALRLYALGSSALGACPRQATSIHARYDDSGFIFHAGKWVWRASARYRALPCR